MLKKESAVPTNADRKSLMGFNNQKMNVQKKVKSFSQGPDYKDAPLIYAFVYWNLVVPVLSLWGVDNLVVNGLKSTSDHTHFF